MGRLDEVIIMLSDLFDEYNTDGDKYLNQEETRVLLDKEVNIDNFKGKLTMENIEDALKKMNRNKDAELRLLDFGRTVTQLAVLYNRRKKQGGDV